MVTAYLRVSTGKQHLENQKEEIIRYASSKELTIDRWIEEVVSGKTSQNSRKLGKLIKSLKAGDVLIVTEISRLSRSLHEIMLIMKRCIDVGVVIHSTKERYIFDDSLNSKVLSFAFGLAAEIEHKLISQRTREALAVRKANGQHVGRTYGSDYLFRGVVNRKAEIIDCITAGLTIKEICLKLGFSQTIFVKLRRLYPEVDCAVKERNTMKGNRWKGYRKTE
ncbi:recombinase family protein [Bacteroides sp.]|uniref:recombinase family protein n=1 Tax=Bacteroides sp. TaxID=29523 RepID=UPI0025C1E47A|nr:recombinase family protein [Bacteroides sp.]